MQSYQGPSKIKFTMSDIQLKITRHTKRPENTTHNETNPSTETDKLVDKDINTDIITIFHMFKKLEARLNTLSMGMKDIIKLQFKLLEIKKHI